MEKLYNALEVAQILKLNKDTILRFIREGKIKAVKVGREYRIREAILKDFLGYPQDDLQEETEVV